MPRPPVGTDSQEQTRTALFAFLAARLNHIGLGDYDRFFREDLRIKVGQNGARRAGRRAREVAEMEGRVTPFEEQLLIDEHALGLEKVIIRVPGAQEGQGALRAHVLALPQVRQVIEGETSGDLYAVAVVRNGEERRALRAQLDELGGARPEMEPVAFETHEPMRRLWRGLATRAAPENQLAEDPEEDETEVPDG
jgi:hypothetical protein